jgi:hypothetical protein
MPTTSTALSGPGPSPQTTGFNRLQALADASLAAVNIFCAFVEPDYFRENQKPEPRVVVEGEIPKGLSFRSAVLSREESAASLPAVSRFLADNAGFGMTKGAE